MSLRETFAGGSAEERGKHRQKQLEELMQDNPAVKLDQTRKRIRKLAALEKELNDALKKRARKQGVKDGSGHRILKYGNVAFVLTTVPKYVINEERLKEYCEKRNLEMPYDAVLTMSPKLYRKVRNLCKDAGVQLPPAEYFFSEERLAKLNLDQDVIDELSDDNSYERGDVKYLDHK